MRRIAALLLVLASAGFAYIRQTTGATPLVRTDNAGIQVYLNTQVVPGTQSSASGSAVTVIAGDSNPLQAVRGALATWNRSGANIDFLPLKSTAALINGSDNQMTIAIGSTHSDVSIVGGALAVTLDTFNPSTGVISDSDIIINPGDCFTTTGVANACTGGVAYDFQATMTHELGHSLGLNHTGLLGSTMFQYNTPTERSLSSDEIAFAYAVYPPAAPASFGTISGTITTGGGSAEPFALVTMADPGPVGLAAGSYSALADANGNYSLKVPAGSYQVYAEPLNGVVQPGNLYLTGLQAAQVQQFMATRFSGVVAVTANNTSTANISVPGGASAFPVPYVAVTSVNGSINGLEFFTGGPTFVASGQSVDLLLAGTGFDATLTAANFAVLGSGVTVGSVRVDPNGSNVGGFKILRVTLNITTQQGPSLASLFVTKGANTLSISGALVIGPPTPTTTSSSVVNSASGLGNGGGNGAVSPGGLYTIYDVPNNPNLGPNSFINNGGYDPYGFLAPTLGGVSVTFDGIQAPVFFVDGAQINLQVPFEVAGKASTKIVVNYLGSMSSVVNVPVLNEQPALISVDSSGKGPVAAVNEDGTINSATHPAPQGTTVTIYGTGVGQQGKVGQQPPYTVFPTGQGAPGVPAGFTGSYTYSIGGSTSAPAAYAGPTPTAVGLAQFNLKIPTTSGPSAGGAVSVVVTSPNGVSSQAGTTIYVQGSSPNVANATGSIDGLYPASGAAAARSWDFSGDGFVVLNYLAGGTPFPNNVVPLSLVDQMALSAVKTLPPASVFATGPNSTWSTSGTLPAGGHFTIAAGMNALANFGGFINLTTRGAQSSKFSLSVDGQLVASTDVPFTTD